MDYLEKGFRKLQVATPAPHDPAPLASLQAASQCKSKLKTHLTAPVFQLLRTRKTPSFGSTLRDVIQSGVENLDSGGMDQTNKWKACK